MLRGSNPQKAVGVARFAIRFAAIGCVAWIQTPVAWAQAVGQAPVIVIDGSTPPAMTAESVLAQEQEASPQDRRTLQAFRIGDDESIVLDGRLDEPAWNDAQYVGGFVQAEPLQGQPASERTEVRVLYNDDAIFIGARLYDRDLSQIVTTDTSRDSNLGDQDSFQVIFDTFRDRQNGFVFGTNADGIQYDAQVRSQGNPSSSWDGSWEVMTQRDEDGWVAEFRIPLRTLRFAPPPQVWGLNFMRNIQRNRERAYWAPLPQEFELGRLSSAGELIGLEVSAPRNFKILPYAVSSANRNFTLSSKTSYNNDWGFDVKYGITPSLNLDMTYNTDFAQVEVDTQQINLTRYNLRFPEKRPFFLENSDLFRVGKGRDLDLFFSRRIGIGEGGSLEPIKGGARVTGKAGGLNVGMLNMQTDDVGQRHGNNFSAVRLSRDLPSRSGLGMIFINRTGTGSQAGTDNWNRTWGLDGRLGVGEALSLTAFAARTETPGLSGRDYAYNLDSYYDNGSHQITLEYGVTGEDFNPEVGFLDRSDGYRRINVRLQETMRQERIRNWGFREFLPHVAYTRYDYLDGRGMQSAELHADNHWDWENGNYISTAVNGTWDGLEEPFEVYPGVMVPAGKHGGLRFTLRANTDQRNWIYGQMQWDVGRFLTGDENSNMVIMNIRQGGRFMLNTTWTNRQIDLPQGSFVTNLGAMGATYNFTPLIFTQGLIQYNDRKKRWSSNIRFHWMQTAGTGLFIVYNDTESLRGLGPVNRALIVKYVHQIDIFR